MNSPLKQNTTTIQDLLNTINSLPEAGTDTSDATASASEILQGETAYVNGEKITGTIETFDGSYECSGESTGGSGSQVDTCEVKIEYYNADFGGIGSVAEVTIYATVMNSNGELQCITLQSGVDFDFDEGLWGSKIASITISNIAKNSILLIFDNGSIGSIDTNLEMIANDYEVPRAFLINQDGNIKLS